MDGYTFAMLRNANDYIRERDETNRQLRADLEIAYSRIHVLEHELEQREAVDLERQEKLRALERQVAQLDSMIFRHHRESACHQAIAEQALGELSRLDPANELLDPFTQAALASAVVSQLLYERGGHG